MAMLGSLQAWAQVEDVEQVLAGLLPAAAALKAEAEAAGAAAGLAVAERGFLGRLDRPRKGQRAALLAGQRRRAVALLRLALAVVAQVYGLQVAPARLPSPPGASMALVATAS